MIRSIELYSSNLVKYLRKVYGLTLKELAEIIESNSNKVERVESHKEELNLKEAVLLAEHFEFSFEDARRGRISLPNTDHADAFKMPDHWREVMYSGPKVIELFGDYYKYLIGEKEFEQFCLSLGIEPLYFFNAGNSCSLEFCNKLIRHLITKGKMAKVGKHVETFANYAIGNQYYTPNVEDYLILSPIERMEMLFQNVTKFEQNHSYSLEKIDESKGSFVFSFFPKEHVNMKLWKDDIHVGGFTELWIREVFKSISMAPNAFVKIIESTVNGDDKCVCEIKLPVKQGVK